MTRARKIATMAAADLMMSGVCLPRSEMSAPRKSSGKNRDKTKAARKQRRKPKGA